MLEFLAIIPLLILLFILAFTMFIILDIFVAIFIILFILPVSIAMLYKFYLYERVINEWKNTKGLEEIYLIYECLGTTSLSYYTYLHNRYFKLGKRDTTNSFWPPALNCLNMCCYPNESALWLQLDKMLYNMKQLYKK
jgi:hypothetical protein